MQDDSKLLSDAEMAVPSPSATPDIDHPAPADEAEFDAADDLQNAAEEADDCHCVREGQEQGFVKPWPPIVGIAIATGIAVLAWYVIASAV